MKTLWAPWRMEHVTGQAPKVSGCLFEPPGEAPQDRAQLLLYRDPLCLVLLNRFPYSNGHLLLAPRRHVACLSELDEDEQAALMALTGHCTTILRKVMGPDGFNIGCNIGQAAGAGIAEHVHIHIVPRWQDDHNFMTVLSEVRAIPEHLEATHERLRPEFQNLLAAQDSKKL